jgi:serine/threonine protein kinase
VVTRAHKPITLSPGQVLRVSSPRGDPFNVTVIRPLGPTRTVFLGRREGTEEPVVLKIPRGRPGIEDRIEREITAQFEHPNLIKLLGTTIANGQAILVLPKLAPNPLLLLNERQVRSRLSRDPGTKYYPLSPNVAVELLCELLRGLETLHAAGFAHNDVKISNLLMDPGATLSGVRTLEAAAQGRFRGILIDLGAARSLAFLEDARRGTIDTDFVPPQLTPAYASPEVLTTQGRPSFGPPGDIYAAGLTAYALYTGHYPYDHMEPAPTFADFGEVAALKAKERRGEVSPVDLTVLEWVPWHDVEILSRDTSREAIESSFRDLIRRMVSQDPAKRPTAAKARAELEWIFHLDTRKGRNQAPTCAILRLRPENRFTEALSKYNAEAPPGERGTARADAPSSIWPESGDHTSSRPPPEDPSMEVAWSRAASAGQISTETLMRYALRAVEGLVAASEPPASEAPPPPPPENVEYEALLKVIGAALGTGIPAPEPPPPPAAPATTQGYGVGVGDLDAWHRGEADAGLSPLEGVPLLDPIPPNMPMLREIGAFDPYARPVPPEPRSTVYERQPQAPLPPTVIQPQPQQQPELREMKRTELFTVRDVWLAAALSRSGLLSVELIAEALGAHVTLRRPLTAILRERYLNAEVVEALRVLARALAQQPHDI